MTHDRNPQAIRAHAVPSDKLAPQLVELEGNVPPPGVRMRRIVASHGALLRAAFWNRGTERGSLLVFPGRTEFVEIYLETVREALAIGLAAGVIDWRHQGLNKRMLPDPRKGHVHRFADYDKDAEAFVQSAEEEGLPRPWFVLAHSMGAAIAYRHVLQSTRRPDGLILLAPMLGLALGGANNRIAEVVAEGAVRLGFGESYVPGTDARTLMEREFTGNPLTSDREKFDLVQKLYLTATELPVGGPTWRWLREALRATRRLRKQPRPGVPILLLLADRDRVVDNRRAISLLANEPGVSIRTLTDCLHCPLLERHQVRRLVFDEVRNFVSRE